MAPTLTWFQPNVVFMSFDTSSTSYCATAASRAQLQLACDELASHAGVDVNRLRLSCFVENADVIAVCPSIFRAFLPSRAQTMPL
jgi:hypothetical protein